MGNDMERPKRIAFSIHVTAALVAICAAQGVHAWALADLGGGVLSPPAISGTNLYVATGVTINVFDVADPSRPVLVDRTREAPTPLPIRGMAIVADTLYVAWSQGAGTLGGASIYSLADTSHPRWVAELDGYPADGLIAAASYVYLVSGKTGTVVLDAHDPLHPIAVGSNSDLIPTTIDELSIVGDRLFIVGPNWLFDQEIAVFDATDPTNIEKIGDFAEDGIFIQRVTIQGDHAIGVGLNLQVLDLTDPANIVQVFSTALSSPASSALVDRDALYLFGDGALQVWNYATPSHPAFVGTAPVDATATDQVALTPIGPLALTDRDIGIVIDDAVPQAPTVKSLLPIPIGVAAAAAVTDGARAYVAEQGYGFSILDLESLQSLGRFDIAPPQYDDRVTDLAEKGTRVFLASDFGIFIVDASDPARPSELGRYALPFANRVYVDRDRAFASRTAAPGAFAVLDVSDPAHMQTLGVLDDIYPHDIVVRGSIAFLATEGDLIGAGGLRMVDVSDESNPTIVGAYFDCGTLTGNAVAVSSDGALAYLACEDGTLRVLDTHDVAHPMLLGTYTLPDTFNVSLSLGLRGDRVYLGHAFGIDEINIEDPTAPAFVSRLPTAEQVDRLALSSSKSILALTAEAGVYRFSEDVIFRNSFD
jgi:hypothetical protein